MITFFQKNENLGFLSPGCCNRIKQPQKLVYIFVNHFSKLYKNCMTSFFPYTSCMELSDKMYADQAGHADV